LDEIGNFEDQFDKMPRLANPADVTQPLADRVRAYLDANCANCHVETGGGNSLIDLRATVNWNAMHILNAIPRHDRMGINDTRIVAPGDPDRSVLLKRISRRGRGQMPPLASHRVDDLAVELLRDWIVQLNLENGPDDSADE
jgi:mono/diheme cytochrome c family protein